MGRHRADFYPTPQAVVDACLKYVDELGRIPYPEFSALDPGSGTGTWGRSLHNLVGTRVRTTGVELHNHPKPHYYSEWYRYDFLTWQPTRKYDLIMGNPPYSKGKAEAFVRHALTMLAPVGALAMLLPLGFLGSQERGHGLWAEHRPRHVGVLVGRPSFTRNGKTDRGDYALYVWSDIPARLTEVDWIAWKGQAAEY